MLRIYEGKSNQLDTACTFRLLVTQLENTMTKFMEASFWEKRAFRRGSTGGLGGLKPPPPPLGGPPPQKKRGKKEEKKEKKKEKRTHAGEKPFQVQIL